MDKTIKTQKYKKKFGAKALCVDDEEEKESERKLKSSQFYLLKKCSSKFNLFMKCCSSGNLNLLSMYKVTPSMQNFLFNFYCFLLYFILILIHIFYCTLAPIVYLSYMYLFNSYSF